MPGLLLPTRLSNGSATVERLDTVVGDEVMHIIRNSRFADDMNAFLEMGSTLRRECPRLPYRFLHDVDFPLALPQPGSEQGTEDLTALLDAVEAGNGDVVRLLLYAGADARRTLQKVLPYGHDQLLTLHAEAVHLAVLRSDLRTLDHLVFFGIDANATCSGSAARRGEEAPTEHWSGVGLLHIAVLNRTHELLPKLLKQGCELDATAQRTLHTSGGDELELVSPVFLAVLLGDVLSASKLLELGAAVDERTRAAALRRDELGEMFGGAPVVGLRDWVAALLTGEGAVQALVDRKTDLGRELDWPVEAWENLLEEHRLAGRELLDRLSKCLRAVPTRLQGVQPVHLACLLQQPWALEMLADAGAAVADAPPCSEVPVEGGHRANQPALARLPLSPLMLCVRVGGLSMLELLCRNPRFALSPREEIPLAPDVTPPFFPRQDPAGGSEDETLAWAWCRLGPLELALLHRHVDVAVLLVRLGADLLHVVDHVAIRPPSHYSITDRCFRGLTPLHLCVLLDNRTAAAALLNEACGDEVPVVAGEHARPQRQALLGAVCTQCWATVATNDAPEREAWLWRDLTPLHLAIIVKSYDVAELLVEASTAATAGKVCTSRDVDGDMERSFSPLLLAFENGLKDLHRKLARKFPTC